MNQFLFKTNLGFAWSVRIMGLMDTGLLILAKLLMTTNPPPNRRSVPKPNIVAILTDGPYIIAVLGLVLFVCPVSVKANRRPLRAFFVLWGLFFPCQFVSKLDSPLLKLSRQTSIFNCSALSKDWTPISVSIP